VIQILDQNLLFVVKNHVCKHCGDVCNDVSLPPFLEVMRQHILGVVGNVICWFVANLTDFPAVSFENRLRFDEIIANKRVPHFLRHGVHSALICFEVHGVCRICPRPTCIVSGNYCCMWAMHVTIRPNC